jgi:hypothetical protein
VTQIKNPSTPGKERAHLSKAIVIAIREFMRQQEPDRTTNDLVAFVILALRKIADGIDKSVAAWEKRGYWVKADKYRMDWEWASRYTGKLDRAFRDADWGAVATLCVEIMGRFDNIKVSDRHRMGKPWEGAYKEYRTQSA